MPSANGQRRLERMNAINRHTKGDAHKENTTTCVQKCTRPVVRHHSLPLFLQTYTLPGAHAEAAMLILLFLSWNNTTTQLTLPSQVVQCAASAACESPRVPFAATVSLFHSRPVDCGGRVKLKKKKIPPRPHTSNYTRCCLDIWTRLCVP